jgi:hypothetical protein
VPNLLPPPTAASSVYVSANTYGRATTFQRPPPPPSAAKWCGQDAIRYCSYASMQEYSQCSRLDCETLFCGSRSTADLCNACLQQRRDCQERVFAKYADCGVCSLDTYCLPDIGQGPNAGYHYCCPLGLSSCDGTCRSTVCGTGYFSSGSCECVCPDGEECRDATGRVVDCCGPGTTCSSGHCCRIGRSWVEGGVASLVGGATGRCCDNDSICDDICCDGDHYCDDGHCCRNDQRWLNAYTTYPYGAAGCCDRSKVCKVPTGSTTGEFHEICCPEGQSCTPDPRFPGLGHCCTTGQVWCQGSYIGGCCPAGTCCGNEPCCRRPGEHCSSGHCCPSGQEWAAPTQNWPGAGVVAQGHCCPNTGKPRTWCGTPDTGFQCCDSDHCCLGADGKQRCCPTNQHCTNGHCCPTGQEWCSNVGRCCDTSSDPACCGVCGRTCGGGRTCCPPGNCVDTTTDRTNCGACGTRCLGADACCPPGVCTDLLADPNHCGACPSRCLPSTTFIGQQQINVPAACTGGMCSCPSTGFYRCGGNAPTAFCSTTNFPTCCPPSANAPFWHSCMGSCSLTSTTGC